MITESLIKQVQLLELLGYPLHRGQAGLIDTSGCKRFDSENHIYRTCTQEHNLDGLPREQATENV